MVGVEKSLPGRSEQRKRHAKCVTPLFALHLPYYSSTCYCYYQNTVSKLDLQLLFLTVLSPIFLSATI